MEHLASTEDMEPPSRSQEIRRPKDVREFHVDEDFHKFCRRHTFRLSCAVSVFIVLAYLLGRLDFSWTVLIILCALSIWQWNEKLVLIQDFAYKEAEVHQHRKKAFENAETAEWFNFFLNRWWLFSDRTIFQLLKNALDPTLETYKPNSIESIELSDFSLGTRTPFIKFLRVFDTTDDLRKIMANEVVFRQPPEDIISRPKYQIVIDADIALDAPDSRFILETKLKLGTTDVCIEGLRIRGRMQLHILFNQNIPFPHIAAISFSFLKQPKFDFQVRLLKRIQLMEYPLIRDWISNLVSDSLKYTLVDPGHITIPLCSDPEVLGRRSGYACGVLTVTIKSDGKRSKQNEEDRWCTVTLNKQKVKTKEMGVDVVWQDTVSLFVDSIQYDKLHIKVKGKRRFGTNYTVVEYVLPLVRVNILQDTIQDLDLEDKNIDGSFLQAHLEYTELSLLDVCNETDEESFEKQFPQDLAPVDVAGVLFVRVHSGSNLIPMDPDGLSDPYVMMFANKELINISHCIEDTLNPEWESMVEFFTADYTQTTLSFIINDRNPVVFSTTARADDNDDFMGSCNLKLTKNDWRIFKKEIDVYFKVHSKSHLKEAETLKRAGSIIVSVVFRPAPSLLKTVKLTKDEGFPEGESLVRKPTKMDAITMEALLCTERGSLTVKIHRARNLAALDFNGKSDPFVTIRIGQAKIEKYKSKICYRTLNPVWNEEVKFAMPETHQRVYIEVWDKDPFTNEKMGHVTFDYNSLEQIATLDSEKKEWYPLKNAKCGEIQLTIVVALPEKPKVPLKEAHTKTIKSYSLSSNDYVMLDFEGQSDKSRPSCSPDPLSSSPESVNSEMEELIRSTKVNEDGSPEIKPRRVVVSSPASGLRQRKITEERNDDEEDAGHCVDGHVPPKNNNSSSKDKEPVSSIVKESGIVDLSKDPTKYCGLKGEIVSLSQLVIPNGIVVFFISSAPLV